MRKAVYKNSEERRIAAYRKSFVERVCLCGCDNKFMQSKYNKGYIYGHSQKITRKEMVGAKAPGWRGGIRKKRGYIFIYNPTHPRADGEYVMEHRLLMEKKLGRTLEPSEHVHHINGIKDDNRIENLFLTTRAGHASIHKTLPKGKWAFKYEQCENCLTTGLPHYARGFCKRCYRKWYNAK